MTTSDQVLHVLCAGAAQGLVKALAPKVAAELGVRDRRAASARSAR